jgi:hypothetical protein
VSAVHGAQATGTSGTQLPASARWKPGGQLTSTQVGTPSMTSQAVSSAVGNTAAQLTPQPPQCSALTYSPSSRKPSSTRPSQSSSP